MMKKTELISTLGSCINACNHCADACLGEENVKMMVDCIRTDRVCAEVCSSLSQVLHTTYDNVEEYQERLQKNNFPPQINSVLNKQLSEINNTLSTVKRLEDIADS